MTKKLYVVLLGIIILLSISLVGTIAFTFISLPKSTVQISDFSDKGFQSQQKLNLINKKMFENKIFNLKNTNDKSISVVNLSATIVYKGDKDDKSTKVDELLNKETDKIKEIFNLYFINITKEQAEDKKERIKMKEQLKNEINNYFISIGEESVVYDIILSDFVFQ